jgi:hypothetical protein
LFRQVHPEQFSGFPEEMLKNFLRCVFFEISAEQFVLIVSDTGQDRQSCGPVFRTAEIKNEISQRLKEPFKPERFNILGKRGLSG